MCMTVLEKTSVAQTRPPLIRAFTGIKGLGVKGEWKNEPETMVIDSRYKMLYYSAREIQNWKQYNSQGEFPFMVWYYAAPLGDRNRVAVHISNGRMSDEECRNNSIRTAYRGECKTLRIPTVYKSFSIDKLADFLLYTVGTRLYSFMRGTEYFVYLQRELL